MKKLTHYPNVHITQRDIFSSYSKTSMCHQYMLQIFYKCKGSQVQELLGQSLNLYFNDTRGQPEFQEVLPVLLSGPSVFIVVFKLTDHLHQKYRVQIVQPEWQRIIMYESSVTVIDSITGQYFINV